MRKRLLLGSQYRATNVKCRLRSLNQKSSAFNERRAKYEIVFDRGVL